MDSMKPKLIPADKMLAWLDQEVDRYANDAQTLRHAAMRSGDNQSMWADFHRVDSQLTRIREVRDALVGKRQLHLPRTWRDDQKKRYSLNR